MSKKMIGNIMKQAQNLQEQMSKAQENAKTKTVTATSGGGMVSVAVNGAMEVVAINIERDVINADDIEMLQDLIIAAVNEGLRRAQQMVSEEMSKATGGLNLPGFSDLFGS